MKALVLAALLAAAACGVRTRPLPPEVVQPEPPTALAATSTVDGVKLTWRRPTKYSGGKHMRDLGGFDVERAVDGDFVRAGEVILDDQTRFRQERTMQWIDTSATPGTTYRYRVVAYTTDGYRSTPAGPVTIAHRTPRPDPPAAGETRP